MLVKAYVDFTHLHHLDRQEISWMPCAKDNMQYQIMGQQMSGRMPEDKKNGNTGANASKLFWMCGSNSRIQPVLKTIRRNFV